MINVKFIKSGLPFRLAYTSGEVGVLSELQAKELQAAGVVEVLTHFNQLPDDVPGRSVLSNHGFTTLDEVKNCADLTELEGIGKRLNQKIIDYINGIQD